MFDTVAFMESEKPVQFTGSLALHAARRAVARATALETGQNVQSRKQKLKEPAKRRFTNIKLAV